jgi:hypothetical protein
MVQLLVCEVCTSSEHKTTISVNPIGPSKRIRNILIRVNGVRIDELTPYILTLTNIHTVHIYIEGLVGIVDVVGFQLIGNVPISLVNWRIGPYNKR